MATCVKGERQTEKTTDYKTNICSMDFVPLCFVYTHAHTHRIPVYYHHSFSGEPSTEQKKQFFVSLFLILTWLAQIVTIAHTERLFELFSFVRQKCEKTWVARESTHMLAYTYTHTPFLGDIHILLDFYHHCKTAKSANLPGIYIYIYIYQQQMHNTMFTFHLPLPIRLCELLVIPYTRHIFRNSGIPPTLGERP